MATNYRKWDHIEISDDEDDTHPNVDTPSLFKWRHEARIKKEQEEKERKAREHAESKLREQRASQLQAQIDELSVVPQAPVVLDELKHELDETKTQEAIFRQKEAELERMEKLHPKWNVDNISKPKHDRTLINKSAPKAESKESEGDALQKYFKDNGTVLQQFGMLSKSEDSHKWLKEHLSLLCDHMGSYLVIWAIDLEVEKKHELVKRVAHQCVTIQFILEIAKSMQRDPRSCVDNFFSRIKTAEALYLQGFNEEQENLIKRIKERAQVRLEDAQKQVEEEERAARLGPAGLDPLEVLAELPPKMREAFETQNTPLLRASFAELSPEQFQITYKRVVGSGLWVPSAGDAAMAGTAPAADEAPETVSEDVD